MNFSLIPSLSICCLFFLAQASADTVLLNNGKSHEGKVIFEDDTHYLLEVQYAEGIKDEMKFLKSDVKSITKQTPDIEEFEKLKALAPAPDLLGITEYEARVKKVQDFIKGFPRSEKLKDARLILDSLTAELKVVREGGMKLSGKMVTAEQYASTAYAYDQLIAVQRINRDISIGNFLGALRLFADYESKFANGKTREELLPKMKQVLSVHQASLTESLAGFDARLKSREAGLARMSPEDRLKTERAIEEQMANLEKRYDAEKAMKNTWITPDAYLEESLVEALRQVENEIKRLNTPQKNDLNLISLEDSYSEAYEQLPGANPEEQKKIFEKLKRERMPEYYIAKLKARAIADQ